MIPNIIVYVGHGLHEFDESIENKTQFPEKSNEQFSEGIFFVSIAIGYTITTVLVIVKPDNPIAYIVILVGTVIIICIY